VSSPKQPLIYFVYPEKPCFPAPVIIYLLFRSLLDPAFFSPHGSQELSPYHLLKSLLKSLSKPSSKSPMSPNEPTRKRAASSVLNQDLIRCTSCRTSKPLADFTKDGCPDRPFKTCKDCRVCSLTDFTMHSTNFS
jgi:hypothetical protein